MFPNVYFICTEYRLQVYTQTSYLFQYPSKVVTETADANIKIGVTKNDEKNILLVIADVNLVADVYLVIADAYSCFKNMITVIRTIQGYQVNPIILRQIHQWKISHKT